MSTSYDVIVVGAGSGGLTAAIGFAKVGKSVLLIEKGDMGGECTNSGCIPSKALLHHAKTYHQAVTLAGHTEKTDVYRSDAFTYVQKKIKEVRDEESPEHLKALGVEVLRGEAAFSGKRTIDVDGSTYHFKHAVIATGSAPRTLEIEGLSAGDALTNQNIFDLENIPEKTLIIGAGPIGLEMGQALALLGSQVTIATIDSTFAPHEDPLIADTLKQRFADLGITIELNAHVDHVHENTAVFTRKIHEQIRDTFEVPFTKILIAIGRTPVIPAGLTDAGIKTHEHGIAINNQYQTTNSRVYAVGDVSQRLKFTHTADDRARQVIERITSKGMLRVNTKRAVPKVTYTDPEIAQVGLSQSHAEERYGVDGIMRIEVPFSAVDRAKTDNAQGHAVVIARRLTGRVLGAHLIGPHVGDMLSVFTLAIDRNISLWKLRATIYAYPTYSLIIKKIGDVFFAQQVASLRTDLRRGLIKHAPKIIAIIFWLALIAGFQYYRISQELSYIDMVMELIEFFTMTVWGPLLYMLLYALRPLILFPATILTALSGALFGFWWGVLYTILGENASANFAYWIGRFFGKDFKLEHTIIGRWVQALRNHSFGAVLFMRLFYVPFDLTNYGSGILKAKWGSYALATLIGIMPGLVTFVALGAAIDLERFSMEGLSADIFNPWFVALSGVIFVISLGLSWILRRICPSHI